MSGPMHDFAVQAAWHANGRQYCTEFGCEQRYFWMVKEMARAIDPDVANGSGSPCVLGDMTRPMCFIFSSQSLAEVFAANAQRLPERLTQWLRGTNQPSSEADGNP